jgi:sugar/nucleoside kinase (ribokinase family)
MDNFALFLGETLVDLICEHPLDDWSQADSFVPHCGGAPTNAALVASRCGAPVAIAGGVGDDQWGRWLETRLRAECVDLRWWKRLPGVQTAIAFDVIDREARPGFLIYGQGIEAALETVEPELEEAVSSCATLVLGSNTLLGERERRISERARSLALSAEKPLVVDVNLRPSRWPDPARAVETVRALCDGAFMVKVNVEEASLLSGEPDPARAAEALYAELGVRVVLVTLGADGALVRGDANADAAGVPAKTVDTTGAGDALLGVVLSALLESEFDPVSAAQILPLAVEFAARSTEGFGAVDSLPDRIILK